MITNGLQHNFKPGQLVWSLTCTKGQVFKIVKSTKKRIVCKEVGIERDGGIVMLDKNLSNSNHTPDNLFEYESHVKVIK